MSNNFFSSEIGDIENYFVTEYWLIDQYVGESLFVWGLNSTVQLGVLDPADRSFPVTTFAGGTDWKQVSAGNNHTTAIKTDGTLWTWGVGTSGQLGTNDTTTRSTPVTTFAGGTNWKQVSAGTFHTTAIKTDGTLWTWGSGSVGQLGNFSTITRSFPVTTFAGGTDWKQVSAGLFHTVAIKTDGTLWTWGYGGYGQLGNSNFEFSRSTPVTTFAGGTDWKQVSAASNHTAAIKTDGTLWTWGFGGSAQLGTNDLTDRSTPVTTFAGGTNWKQVDAGGSNTTAIKTDGTLWTWGLGTSGQLGTNDTTTRSTPVTTFAGGTNWKQVDAGGSNTTAIKTDGTLWTWGLGTSGQLGTNDTTTRSTPVTTFAGGSNWKQVSTGDSFTIALANEVDLIPDLKAGQQLFTTTGSQSWTVPDGVTIVDIVCVGAGGGGGSQSGGLPGSGGGGGALSYSNNVSVTSGESLTIVVGAGGSAGTPGTAGGDSSVSRDVTTLVLAKGGDGGTGGVANASQIGGAGGASASGVGDVKQSGGDGGLGVDPDAAGGGGAGGYSGAGGKGGDGDIEAGAAGTGGGAGGGAGDTDGGSGGGGGGGVGVLGSGSNGAGGVSDGDGGGGGSGGDNGTTVPSVNTDNGQPGGLYGGGGGGANDDAGAVGGAGANGAVRIIWGIGRDFPSTLTNNV
jgi:alpha-tubulin suppressor-like RCC1 family protein